MEDPERNLAAAFADANFIPESDAEIVTSKPETFRYWVGLRDFAWGLQYWDGEQLQLVAASGYVCRVAARESRG